MTFLDALITQATGSLRARILEHPLWSGIEDGTLEKERLALFALQDWLIVRDAYRLDGMAIAAAAPDHVLQELLIDKLVAKKGCHELLIRFGEAVGLSRSAFEDVEPVAGCQALVSFFYWMLTTGTPLEWLAAVGASEAIFAQICLRIQPALMQRYGLSAAQVEFFTAHDVIGERVEPVDRLLNERATTAHDQAMIARAVRLSHEYEIMFYDAILQHPLEGLR
jgi:pyrroloquinoline-quinone synthase